MKYSLVTVTDDNMDDCIESLFKEIDMNPDHWEGFIKELPKGFIKQEHPLGFDEFIQPKTSNNPSGDNQQALQSGLLAYEFGNGFLTFRFETVL